jgi:hypothetical protein
MGSSGALAQPCARCHFAGRCDRFEEGATCVVAREYQAELEAELMGLEHVREQDALVVHNLSVTATGLRIVDEYIAAVGPFRVDEEGNVSLQTALTDWREKLSRSLVQMADALGLTPRARAQLKLGGAGGVAGGLAALLIEAERIEGERRKAEAANTVEGQFELEMEE